MKTNGWVKVATAVALLAGTQAHAQQPPPGAGIQREKTVTQIAPGKWTGKRLADWQPDVQGHWSNTIANHNNWTDPQGGVPGDPGRNGPPKTPRSDRAPSRVSDPVDGELPFQPCEGNTLVVDVTNNNAKARLARTGEFFSGNIAVLGAR